MYMLFLGTHRIMSKKNELKESQLAGFGEKQGYVTGGNPGEINIAQ